MSGSISPPLLETIARRACVIQCLLDDRADKRELEAVLDVSRTTVDRAVSSLDDAGCIVYQDGKWEVTLLGKLAYNEYEQLAARYRGLTAAQPLLDHLSPETPSTCDSPPVQKSYLLSHQHRTPRLHSSKTYSTTVNRSKDYHQSFFQHTFHCSIIISSSGEQTRTSFSIQSSSNTCGQATRMK